MKYSLSLRNVIANAKIGFIGAGALLKIYDSSAAELVSIPCGTLTNTDGNITFTTPSSAVASATGTATSYKVVKADGSAVIIDGTVSIAGGTNELKLATLSIAQGVQVQITSWTITGGNA